MTRMLSAAAAFLLMAAGAAAAQDQPTAQAPAQGQGRGGPGMAAMRQACAADMQKFCADKAGPDRRQCMRDHEAEFSDGCKAARADMQKQMHMQ